MSLVVGMIVAVLSWLPEENSRNALRTNAKGERTPTNPQPQYTVRTVSVTDDAETFWKILNSYRNAKGYSDQGAAVLRYRSAEGMLEDRAPLAISWQSPDRLAVSAYDARCLVDGRYFWSWVMDPQTNHFDNQVSRRPYEGKMTLDQLLRDSTWSQAAAAGLAGPPPQLTWLFVDQPKEERPAVKRIDDAKLDGRDFARFELGEGRERRTFWIDPRTGMIRRIELPPPPTPGAMDVQLTVELIDAKFAPAEKELVALPQDRRLVSALIAPPPPPVPLIGQRPPSFKLSSHDSRVTITQNGTGRVAILLWFADHPASQAVLQDLQKFADEKSSTIDYLTIMSEPNPQQGTGDLLRRWRVGLPWTNDASAIGRDIFRIREAPTLIVLDAQGTVQLITSRWSEQLMPTLAFVLDQIKAGKNPGKDSRAAYEQAVEQYRRQIDALAIKD
jgi:hypothetical protein